MSPKRINYMTHPVSLPLLSRVKIVILKDVLSEVNVVVEGLSSAN